MLRKSFVAPLNSKSSCEPGASDNVLVVSVPTLAPGVIRPFAATLIPPLIVPVPPSVPPEATVTSPPASEPFTRSVPALTVVAPE